MFLEENIKISTFYGLIFFLLIYFISYFYFDKMVKNLNLIVYFFLITFFLTTLISIINYQQDAPFFCGGIKNFLYLDLDRPFAINKLLIDYNLSFKHILFRENSHLGMIAPAVIIYSIYKITNQKNNKAFILLSILFFIICFVKSSTTLLVGTIVSIFVITLFNFKYIPNKTLIAFAFIFLTFTIIIFSDKQCKIRFIPKYNQHNVISKKFTDFTKDILFKDSELNNSAINSTLQKEDCAPGCLDIISGSASSAVFFRSLLITKHSLSIRPLGWGINRYPDGFDAYRNEFNEDYDKKFGRIENINRIDGVNNFNKIIVEFGYLSIFLFIFILVYLTDKKITLEEKLFFLPAIITQMIRGAGYFNGGFVLILIIMLLTYLNRNRAK